MPVQLTSEKWSFTSFSASCVQCGCSSEPGDVFYSGLASSGSAPGTGENEDDPGEDESEHEQDAPEQDGDPTDGSSDEPAYERVDYCADCWQTTTPDLYSYWRTEVPEPEEEDKEPDRSTLAGLFRGLVQQRNDGQSGDQPEESDDGRQGDRDPLNQGLLYLLSLMLMRKGFLSLENKQAEDGQDRLNVRVKGTEDEVYEIREPELDPDTREQVKTKLAELLDMERNGAE